MRAARVLAALVTAVAAPLAPGAQPVTSANWSRHPAVAEVRAIYREIAAAEAAGRLRKQQRKFEFCQPYEDTGRTLYLDARGAVRSYRFAGGSEDSTAERALYYDRGGHLRFVLIRAGAVNGTSLELRIYLSKTGERLWEKRDLLKGPGYTFPNPWPQSDLVGHPRQAFDAASPCPELK